MQELYLVRHGQTMFNEKRVIQAGAMLRSPISGANRQLESADTSRFGA